MKITNKEFIKRQLKYEWLPGSLGYQSETNLNLYAQLPELDTQKPIREQLKTRAEQSIE
jgi:hypothetical protein